MNGNQVVLDLAGDTVTPTDLAERMEEKLRRHISLYVASYLYTNGVYFQTREEIPRWRILHRP